MDEISGSSEENLEVSDEYLSSDYSDCNVDEGLYTNEPEYTEAEMKTMKFSSDEKENSSDDSYNEELDSSRLENLHWCRCCKCTIMPTFKECKCCIEFSKLLRDKLEGVRCITEHKDFDIICLHKTVLQTAFIQHCRYKKNFTDVKNMTVKYVCLYLLF